MKKKWLLAGSVAGIITIGIASFLIWNHYSNKPEETEKPTEETSEEENETSTKCKNKVTGMMPDWQIYEGPEQKDLEPEGQMPTYTLKYPPDWTYDDYPIFTNKQQWYTHFWPIDTDDALEIGTAKLTLEEFRSYLDKNEEMNITLFNTTYEILGEETAKIGGITGTKLIVQNRSTNIRIPRREYIYYIPRQVINFIFKQPALEDSSKFERCEPEYSDAMLKTFQFTD